MRPNQCQSKLIMSHFSFNLSAWPVINKQLKPRNSSFLGISNYSMKERHGKFKSVNPNFESLIDFFSVIAKRLSFFILYLSLFLSFFRQSLVFHSLKLHWSRISLHSCFLPREPRTRNCLLKICFLPSTKSFLKSLVFDLVIRLTFLYCQVESVHNHNSFILQRQRYWLTSPS